MARRQAAPVDLLTVPAAAARLGCSETHVYRLIEDGDLRMTDIALSGSQRSKGRVRSDDIAALIEARTRVAVSAAGGAEHVSA